MCGICCICDLDPSSAKKLDQLFDLDFIKQNSFISQRGPDAHNASTCTLWSKIQTLFAGFVLHIRGDLTPQPMRNEDGDLLLWNGEIFGGIDIGADENDTQILFDQLVKCSNEEEVLTTVQTIQGPWALIFWQAKHERLWFGRDVFGRRSLLWHLPGGEDSIFALSSVPIKPLDYEEIPSLGMFCLECSHQDVSNMDTQHQDFMPVHTKKQNSSAPLTLHVYPWQGAMWPGTDNVVASDSAGTIAQNLGLDQSQYITINMHNSLELSSWMPVLNSEIPADESLLCVNDDSSGSGSDSDLVRLLRDLERKGMFETLVKQCIDVLYNAVNKRVHNLPRGHLPPSRSTDCSTKCTAVGGTVDNFNLAPLKVHPGKDSKRNDLGGDMNYSSLCSSEISQDTTSSNAGFTETVHNPQQDSKTESLHSDHPDFPVSSKHSSDWQVEQPGLESGLLCPTHTDACGYLGGDSKGVGALRSQQAHVAILFSGGVDSTVLAALADRCLPEEEPVDLINVAFEQKKHTTQQHKQKRAEQTASSNADSSCMSYSVPDRLTGYSALAELNPARQWNFVEVNVTQEMLQEQRSKHVRHLVYPLKTVLDDSIGCAVWFAARGRGILGNGPNRGASYVSTARVLLCGMGADEQLAGYSRHRVRFKQESWLGLITELNMEIHRISARNLGRDDRIITDHGKESRFPYLDEDVVHFLANLPIHHKADLRLPRGVGEKLLLRLVALKLGLPTTAALPKRAIQFGSRIAKLEQSKEKGAQTCQRLTQE